LITPIVALRVVKLVHTAAWAFFAGCILAIPVAAWQTRFDRVGVLTAAVMAEVMVLAMNGWKCPLTAVAARFTDDRRDNFDIYLPRWLARYNKQIFGPLFVLGLIVSLLRWWGLFS
jgi:hypothetical protein